MDTVRDIERIGDHFENLVELGEYQQSNRVKISEAAMADLTEMLDLTISTVKESITALGENNEDAARRVVEKKIRLIKWNASFAKAHSSLKRRIMQRTSRRDLRRYHQQPGKDRRPCRQYC